MPGLSLALNMNLEDHLGDILRKARQAANLSSADAAKAAGLSEEEIIAALEEARGRAVIEERTATGSVLSFRCPD